MTVAVIADIVGSRRMPDRSAAQRALESAIARVERDLPLAREPLSPTVGDELQGVYDALPDALGSLLLLQLALPDGVECRFGVGIGEIGPVASSTATLSDGSGWWSARAAIETVHRLQKRTAPNARTWIVASPEQDDSMRPSVDLANAYVLARDQLVTSMNERARRLTYGRCLGVSQADLAKEEGVTQPAVSQALAAAGASAVVEGFLALRAERAA